MMPIDHLDGEIRRALQELGDAADVAPSYTDLGAVVPVRAAPRARRAAWLLPAAVVATGLAAVIVVSGTRDDRSLAPSRTAAPSSAGMPTDPTDSVEPTLTTTADAPTGLADSPLARLVNPLLPAGFQLTFVASDPLLAIAFDANGTRLTVAISLDGAGDALHEDYRAEEWHAIPQGQATVDGQRIVTTSGDVVATWADYGPNLRDLPMVVNASLGLPVLTAQLADDLVDPIRQELAALRGVQVGAGPLETLVGERLSEATGQQVALRGGSASGLLQVAVQPDVVVGPTAESRPWTSVTALYTPLSLAAGVSRPDQRVATATRWVNGWQLVLSTIAPAGEAAPTDDHISGLLDAVEAAFADWTPPTVTEPVCDTYVTRRGDSSQAIAQRFGLSTERLAAVNPDDDKASGRSPVRWNLPCDAVRQVRSTDHSGLAGYIGEPAANFAEQNRVTVASDQLVWVVAGGASTSDGSPAIYVQTFDRGTGKSLVTQSWGLPATQCAGPIEIVDASDAPLEAIPIRCVADGATATMDVFSGLPGEFAR